MLHIIPCTIREACRFVAAHHRHNVAPQGGLFAVGVSDGAEMVAVAIAGRPVARLMQDGSTIEVTRCCAKDGAPLGAVSCAYAALWRAARALGWRRLITYTLTTESGASLRGAGWRVVAQRGPRSPASWQSRPGRAWHDVTAAQKFLWEAA